MSPTGQTQRLGSTGSTAVVVATFSMPHRSKYSWHVHDSHQLAWAPIGVLSVATETRTWVLPPSRALWIPAGVPHETMAAGQATMRSLYLLAQGCRVRWPEPQPVVVRPLLRELINHLSETELSSRRRHRSEAVLIDLLEPVTVTTAMRPTIGPAGAGRRRRATPQPGRHPRARPVGPRHRSQPANPVPRLPK